MDDLIDEIIDILKVFIFLGICYLVIDCSNGFKNTKNLYNNLFNDKHTTKTANYPFKISTDKNAFPLNKTKTKPLNGPFEDGYREFEFNGLVVKGMYKNGELNGQGEISWANGDKYVGQFVDGERSGLGTYTWSNGNKYEGKWKNGNRNGYGVYTYANGRKLEGIWKNDVYQNSRHKTRLNTITKQNSKPISHATSSSNSNSTPSTTQTIRVEHVRQPQPVQVWIKCPVCIVTPGVCTNCGGRGEYVGISDWHFCSPCGGTGRCSTCGGRGGHYEIQYR